MHTGRKNSHKRRFKPFSALFTWWKRRKLQYLVHVNAPEELNKQEFRGRTNRSTESGITASEALITPLALHLENKIESILQIPAANSFYDSIESMDSIIDSHCTHSEDDASKSVGFVHEFIMEHLNFLSQSTQPQQVELLYDTH